MKSSIPAIAAFLAVGLSACQQQEQPSAGTTDPTPNAKAEAEVEAAAAPESGAETLDIAPGVTGVILQKGYGRAAEVGDHVEVHYTGWLYDADAEDQRGSQFDSSIDRGDRFMFQLGAGRVIKGWDLGVAGMLIGEKRLLTLAPEMAYGDRGAGNVIPPGATLLFEIELFDLESPEGSNEN